MTVESIELRRFSDLTPVRQHLIDVYADVRAPLLHLPNYSLDVFAERLDRHAAEAGWEAVLGYDHGEPVGYAYANTLTPDDRWWTRMTEPLPERYTTVPTMAVKEIGVRPPWRGTGIARRIHDELLAHRTEDRATLLVNPLAGDGKVQALYETWGYTVFNSQQPSPEAPKLVAMIRPRTLAVA